MTEPTMTAEQMPALPDGDMVHFDRYGDGHEAWSRSQMLAYGRQCAEAAREDQRRRDAELLKVAAARVQAADPINGLLARLLRREATAILAGGK